MISLEQVHCFRQKNRECHIWVQHLIQDRVDPELPALHWHSNGPLSESGSSSNWEGIVDTEFTVIERIGLLFLNPKTEVLLISEAPPISNTNATNQCPFRTTTTDSPTRTRTIDNTFSHLSVRRIGAIVLTEIAIDPRSLRSNTHDRVTAGK